MFQNLNAGETNLFALTEEGRLRVWRFEEYLRLGFGTSAAIVLVDAGADLGLARGLISLGYPHRTALAILH
jgi:hypothetical protein